jgi:hypothetical protein
MAVWIFQVLTHATLAELHRLPGDKDAYTIQLLSIDGT